MNYQVPLVDLTPDLAAIRSKPRGRSGNCAVSIRSLTWLNAIGVLCPVALRALRCALSGAGLAYVMPATEGLSKFCEVGATRAC